MRKFSKFLLGLIFGAAFASILAILFAPESGMDFRKKLYDLTNQFFSQIRAAMEKRQRELEEEIKEYKGLE